MNVETKQSKEIWRSPDGNRVIYELVLESNGRPFPAKTFSREIAETGWSGEVESYEKTGRGGVETFVKQPQRQEYKGGYAKKDEAAIQAMWAITKAIEWAGVKEDVELKDIEPLAVDFNAMVDRVKASQATPAEVPGFPIDRQLDAFLEE